MLDFVGKADSISLLIRSLFGFSVSSRFSLERLYVSRNLPILLGCPICWGVMFVFLWLYFPVLLPKLPSVLLEIFLLSTEFFF